MSAPFTKIAVCGAGAMGSGIAEVAAQRGAQVIVFDVNAAALSASEARITKSIAKLVEKGKLSADDGAAAQGRLSWTDSLTALADAELVIEAIIENAEIKGELFAGIEGVVGPDTVIASNTSSLPIARLARTLTRPDRFVGMHFFNPATVMKLVEIISGPASDPAAVGRVMATAKAWGKVAVKVADVPGFIVNRVARPFYSEAFAALQERAAPPHAIDALFRAAGFRMGPLELTDFIGQDINFAVARSVYDAYFGQCRFVPQLTQGVLVDAGYLGRKSGRGVYDYADGAVVPALAVDDAQAIDDSHRALAANLADWQLGAMHDCGAVSLGLTNGQTAFAKAQELGRPVALFDWTLAAADGPIGFAASDETAEAEARAVIAAAGRAAVALPDRPGLLVCRTWAQIINAAADAVFEHVSDEAGIDSALQFGANYPIGPFAQADRYSRTAVAGVLSAIARETGQALYAPSQYMRKW